VDGDTTRGALGSGRGVGGYTPWRPRALPAGIAAERERLALAWRGLSAELALPRLAQLLGVESATASVSRIGIPTPLREDSVTAAVCTTDAGQHPVAAIVLPLETARGIVDATLRRSPGSVRHPLTAGEEGALLFALDRAGGDWLAAGGERFRITGLLAAPDQIAELLGASPRHEVEVSLAAGDLAGRARVVLPAPALPALAARCAQGLGRALCWPVRFRCATGEARIAALAAGSLAEGDVVVLDRCGHPIAAGRDRPCALECGGLRLAAQWLDDRSLVLVSKAEGRSTMANETTERIEARLDAPVDGAAMEVVAQVEVGRITLTVEQALGLVPGRVLALDRKVGPDVWLRVGDKLIARGELVSCDGALAVEVTEVP
jgi:flagellar motor switch/type III secretory pathway protein FliN